MTYASWQPRYRVETIAPGKLDLLVVTLINGKRAALCSVLDYDAALAKARAFGKDHRCQIKVLSLTGPEARNFFNWSDDDLPPEATDERKAAIDQLLAIARDSNDTDARQDAFDLLNDLGVITP